MKQYGVHVTGCVEVVLSVTLSLSLSAQSIQAAAIRFHYAVAPGSKKCRINWSLLGPFGVRLIESDPSVGRSLFFQRDD